MKTATMRRLDRWVGIPLCVGLTVIRRLGDLFRRICGRNAVSSLTAASEQHADNATQTPPTILLVKLAEMGSTVLALPAINRLRELYPGVKLHYLCFAENSGVLSLMPELPIEVHSIRSTSLPAVIWDSLRTLWRLRRLRLDATIDLEMFSRATAALVYLSGAKVRVGFHRFYAEGLHCGDLFTHRVSYHAHQHASASFLTLAEASARRSDELPLLKMDIERPTSLPQFQPTEDERQSVLEKLGELGYPAESRPPILIVNVNASDLLPLRRWSTGRWEDLTRRCLDAYPNLWVVLTGSPSEASPVMQFHDRLNHERIACMAGRTSLRELVTLYGLSDVLITNDSGPAHFAATTQIQIISLFGPETPELYRPLSEHGQALSARLACSPCINVFNQRQSACTDNQCMAALTVDHVFAAFENALRAN